MSNRLKEQNTVTYYDEESEQHVEVRRAISDEGKVGRYGLVSIQDNDDRELNGEAAAWTNHIVLFDSKQLFEGWHRKFTAIDEAPSGLPSDTEVPSLTLTWVTDAHPAKLKLYLEKLARWPEPVTTKVG